MQEKKATQVAILDLRHVGSAVADFFVICSGNSDTQVDAITDAVRLAVQRTFQEHPWQSEGKTNREWVLLDYVSAVAHIFRKDKRTHYGLETLWGDAKITYLNEA